MELCETVDEAPAPDRMTAPGLFPLRETGSGSSGGAQIFVVRTTRVHPPKASGAMACASASALLVRDARTCQSGRVAAISLWCSIC